MELKHVHVVVRLSVPLRHFGLVQFLERVSSVSTRNPQRTIKYCLGPKLDPGLDVVSPRRWLRPQTGNHSSLDFR